MNNDPEIIYDNDGESLSEMIERDARRYNKAFTEEEEARLI